MKNVLVVAPHPDDESLGCGGALLRHVAEGDKIHWLIITAIQTENGFKNEQVKYRESEIKLVAQQYGFSSVHNLSFPTTKLDITPIGEIIDRISAVFKKNKPEVIYLPHPGDIHTDHKIVFDAVSSCTKWFRYKSIKRVLAYETLSETDYATDLQNYGFRANVFIDINNYLEKKLEIIKIYASELGKFPFPRSEEAIRALAALRGAASGCRAAEAFMLLKEIL